MFAGGTRSRIDLRGVGAQRTLVLIDGRRLPSLPDASTFDQGDLNGVPLGAIERIETLHLDGGRDLRAERGWAASSM